MKKGFTWIMALVLTLMCACAFAEETDDVFSRLDGVEWSFCSGVGAWSTDMRILPDGTFSGEFHDSDMGTTGETYPNGTVYFCSFTGRMSLTEQVDDLTWKIRVDSLTVAQDQPEEEILDGVRYVRSGAYGLTEGAEMLLFAPGTPVAGFTEDMKIWAHLNGLDDAPSELEGWFLYGESGDDTSGFVGVLPEMSVMIPNPWTDMTEEELRAASGLSFTLPADAESTAYRFLDAEKLAEVDFTWSGDEFCLRAMPFVPEDGAALPDISGMYFAWENVEETPVSNYTGTIGQAQTGSDSWVERVIWYDEASGTIRTLSVTSADPDGLDLGALAEQICYPAQ